MMGNYTEWLEEKARIKGELERALEKDERSRVNYLDEEFTTHLEDLDEMLSTVDPAKLDALLEEVRHGEG